MNSDQSISETFAAAAPERGRFGIAVAIAVVLHVLALWGLAASISFQLPVERRIEPKIVALAPRLHPPPPDVETFGPKDVVTALPRFRPRVPAEVPQRMRLEGDPALAVWTHLCNRDVALSEATKVRCPTDFGNFDFGMLDPLNRRGDVGALFGADTTTMSLDEVAKKKGWLKPKSPLEGAGARAKDSGVGPGHDPFAFLPGHQPVR